MAVEALADAGELASVVIETCPTRWAKSKPAEMPMWLRPILQSEMVSSMSSHANAHAYLKDLS
jgi:hypothetical protein